MSNKDRGSLFLGDRELQFIQNVATEIIEVVTQQKITYYAIESSKMDQNDLYGEALAHEKVFRQPIELYVLVLYNEPVIFTGAFSTETQYSLKFYVQRFRVEQDLKVEIKMGDFVEFGEKYYEINKVWYPQLIAGQDTPGFSMGTYAEAHSTRAEIFSPNRKLMYDPSINSDVIR